MFRVLKLFVGVAIVMVAAPLLARVEYFTTVGGQRIPGSRVCFSRGGYEGEYFARFMGDGTEVRCVSADDVIELPKGDWVYYATNAEGFVSVHPYYVSVQQPSSRYESREITMVPAATIDLSSAIKSIPSSCEVVLYFPNHAYPSSPSNLRRVPIDQTDVLIPADSAVVPIAMRGWEPVAIGKPISLAAGSTRVIEPFVMRPAVVIPLRLNLSQSAWSHGAVPPFSVIAKTKSATIQPLVPIREGIGSERSLLLYVTNEPITAVLAGELWQSQTIEIVPGGGATVAEPGFVAEPAAALNVEWSFNTSAEILRKQNPECAVNVQAAVVRVSHCEPADTCAIVAERQDADFRGVLNVPALKPGEYRVEMNFPPLQSIKRTVVVQAFERRSIEEVIGDDIVTGRVSRDGNPVNAIITIPGVTTATDIADGAFALPVRGALPLVPVSVQLCEASTRFVTVPAEPVPAGGRFDIVIPNNKLEVRIVDAASREPLAAVVSHGAVDPRDPEGDVFSVDTSASANGLAVIEPVATTNKIRVCAQLDGYEQNCLEPFEIAATTVMRRELALRAYGHRGKVVTTTGRVSGGAVFIVGADGTLRERVQVRPADGTFWFDAIVNRGDYAVLVSQSHPLVVQRLVDQSPLTISVPVTTLAFTVDVAPEYRWNSPAATIRVAGLLVPHEAFAQHMAWRGGAEITRGMSYVIKDISPAPVSILLGPSIRERPVDFPPGADIFALPYFRGFIDEIRVGQDWLVTFR